MHGLLSVVSLLMFLTLGGLPARAEAPDTSREVSERSRDPVGLLPNRIDLLIQVPQPRRLFETALTSDLFLQLQQLVPVREFLDSTNVRRARQLVAYFEKELGLPWPQLLDRLAGRGIALGVLFGPNPASLSLVVQGEDELLMQQFFQLGLKILEQEMGQYERKGIRSKKSYKEYDIISIDNKIYAAIVGGALLLSNSEASLCAGLDCCRKEGKQSLASVSGVAEATQLLPPQPLVSFWLNMAKIQQSPEIKARNYQQPPRDDPLLTIAYGPYLNLLSRTPYVCAGIYWNKNNLTATIRIPRGRQGMGADQLLHLPPAGAPGSRPLLEPKNVLYSESKYFDIANIWQERKKLFNERQVRQLERVEKQLAPFLVGSKFSKLLMQAGPYYRFVAVHQPSTSYKITPKISIPAFALVWELREPEALGQSLETLLRSAALLAGSNYDLRLVEEQYKGCKLVGYRFPEELLLQGDVNDLRFNFAPCFTRVGDQFVVSSTVELCRELVDLLHKEGRAPTRGHSAASRARLYSRGIADYLQTFEDLLLTQAALDQAMTPQEARRQVKRFLDLIRGLGEWTLEPRFDDQTFQYNLRLAKNGDQTETQP